MGARSLEHAVVADQPRDRMAAVRAAKAARAETRNRLRGLKERYWAEFEEYLRLQDSGAPDAEVRAARSKAWGRSSRLRVRADARRQPAAQAEGASSVINYRLLALGVVAAVVLGWLLAAVVSNVLDAPPPV